MDTILEMLFNQTIQPLKRKESKASAKTSRLGHEA